MSAIVTSPISSASIPAPIDRRLSRRPIRSAASRTTRPAVTGSVSEATYRRRRAVVGIVLAVLVAVGAVLAHDVLAGSGGDPASAAASQPAHTRSTVTARPGDTLWSIGERHHGDVALSRYVDALVDLNGGAAIQAGQAVVLP
jgi:nucleoid-associated protein YgaU